MHPVLGHTFEAGGAGSEASGLLRAMTRETERLAPTRGSGRRSISEGPYPTREAGWAIRCSVQGLATAATPHAIADDAVRWEPIKAEICGHGKTPD